MKSKSSGRAKPSDTQSTPESFGRMTDAIVGSQKSDADVSAIYPLNIMKKVRQYLDLEPTDTSRDVEIMAMSKEEVFKCVCEWEGLLGSYSNSILSWVKSIYNVELDD